MRILKKVLKWTGIIIGGLVIIALITHIVLNIVWGRELQNKLAELKAKGEPTTIAEIRPAPVPDNENAAVLYNKVFVLMISGEGGRPYISKKKVGKFNKTIAIIQDVKSYADIFEWTEKQRQEIPKLVNSSDMQHIYALLEQASKRPECNFNLKYEDGSEAFLPHLSKMRTLARLLSVKALIEAQSGDLDKAFDTIFVGLKMSNHLKNEPFLISQLVRIACDMIIVDCIEQTSNKYNISQEKARNLIIELEKHLGSEPFKKSMDGERVLLGRRVEFNKFLNRGHSMKILEAFFRSGYGFLPELYYLEGTWLFNPLIKKDLACYMTLLSEIKGSCDIPYSESIAEENNIESKFKTDTPEYCIVTRMFVPALFRNKEKMSVYETQIQICRTGLALKIYKTKYGAYPESLATLTPDILEKIPSDPFTDKNLIYKKSKEGFELYSLGPNMKDDGGIPRFRGKAKTDAEIMSNINYDIVWKCEK